MRELDVHVFEVQALRASNKEVDQRLVEVEKKLAASNERIALMNQEMQEDQAKAQSIQMESKNVQVEIDNEKQAEIMLRYKQENESLTQDLGLKLQEMTSLDFSMQDLRLKLAQTTKDLAAANENALKMNEEKEMREQEDQR